MAVEEEVAPFDDVIPGGAAAAAGRHPTSAAAISVPLFSMTASHRNLALVFQITCHVSLPTLNFKQRWHESKESIV